MNGRISTTRLWRHSRQWRRENVTRYAADLSENGVANWSTWRKRVEDARNSGAELLGATRDEIAVIRNTTEGINLVAEGMDWREGDNVVTLASEFPSNLYPWMNLASRGVETRLVPCDDERLDLNRVAELCDERTRIVSASWVGYATGWRNDIAALAELAHDMGALFFLDAIQALGVFPLDVAKTPIDFLAADGHKWLLSPEGAGLFYLRREHIDRLRPVGVGWNSVVHAGDFTNTSFQLKSNAERYEGGSHGLSGIVGLAATLEWMLPFGVDRIAERLLQVTDEVCNRLQASGARIASCRDGERRSGIVAFEIPGQDPREVQRRCRDRNVIVNCRAGRVRISPHAYTNDDDIDRLLQAVSATG